MLPFPLDPATTAALIIDLQKGYCEIGGDIAKALGWDCTPLHKACERHIPFLSALRALLPPEQIIWTRMEEHEETLAPNIPAKYFPDFQRLCLRGTQGFDYHIVKPAASEVEVFKTHLSAFHQGAHLTIADTKKPGSTSLHGYLQEKGIKTIVFTGVFATRCVYASIIAASSLGYQCVCLSDLVAVPAGDLFERERKAHDFTQNMLYAHALSAQDFLSVLRTKGATT